MSIGRPLMEFPEHWEEFYTAWRANEITAVQFYFHLGLKKSTFYRMVERYETNLKATESAPPPPQATTAAAPTTKEIYASLIQGDVRRAKELNHVRQTLESHS